MTGQLTIQQAGHENAGILADLIRQAYKTVADEFSLTRDNCPKHPSNCTPGWIQKDFKRSVSYFAAKKEDRFVGCAAIERADDDTIYLERLAVLPEYRRQGIGRQLVAFIVEKAKTYKAKTVGIGIINEQTVLKQWYQGLGFEMNGTKNFDHLPFTVGFMNLKL